eukprot:jgi/Chlat1/3136/Chrsp21S03363
MFPPPPMALESAVPLREQHKLARQHTAQVSPHGHSSSSPGSPPAVASSLSPRLMPRGMQRKRSLQPIRCTTPTNMTASMPSLQSPLSMAKLQSAIDQCSNLNGQEAEQCWTDIGFAEVALNEEEQRKLIELCEALGNDYSAFQAWERLAEIAPAGSPAHQRAHEAIHAMASEAKKQADVMHWKENLFMFFRVLDTAFE